MYLRFISSMRRMTMDTRSNPPALVDTSTGSEFRRWEIGGATMTIETTQHPYRRLAGASFVTLSEDIRIVVTDDRWKEVFGLNVILPGGCEIDVDDAELERALGDIEECDENWADAMERRPDLFCTKPPRSRHTDGSLDRPEVNLRNYDLMVPVTVNDADLPPMRILIPLQAIQTACQPVEIGDGSHSRGTSGDGDNTSFCNHTVHEFGLYRCRSCLRRWWTARAKEMGVIDGQ